MSGQDLRYPATIQGLNDLTIELAKVWVPLKGLPGYEFGSIEVGRMENFKKHASRLASIEHNGGIAPLSDIKTTIGHGVNLLKDVEEGFDDFIVCSMPELKERVRLLIQTPEVWNQCGNGILESLEKLETLSEGESSVKEVAEAFRIVATFVADAEKMRTVLEDEKKKEKEKAVRVKRGETLLRSLSAL